MAEKVSVLFLSSAVAQTIDFPKKLAGDQKGALYVKPNGTASLTEEQIAYLKDKKIPVVRI